MIKAVRLLIIFLFIIYTHFIAIIMHMNISFNIIIKNARYNIVIFFEKLEV